MEPFGDKARFFVSAQELSKMLLQSGRKHVIFRYQNSSPRLFSDLAYTILILLLVITRKLIRTEIYWILHNIDRETVDDFPFLTMIRRELLRRASKSMYVTDPMFKRRFFPSDKKVISITFGPKPDGSIRKETINAIAESAEQFDLVALCLGAKGDKYVHFRRLDRLSALAKKYNKTLVFVLPEHVEDPPENAIVIGENNIDEKAIAPYVDFIYRVNNDISMPYTLYAACGAKIPIVTADSFFTYEIVKEYEIGFSEEEYFTATDARIEYVKQKMEYFLRGRTWSCLADEFSSGRSS